MPYIDWTPVEKVKEAIDLWKGVMHDPNLDGYNGLACKKKIEAVRDYAIEALKDAPQYYEEEPNGRHNWYGYSDEDEDEE